VRQRGEGQGWSAVLSRPGGSAGSRTAPTSARTLGRSATRDRRGRRRTSISFGGGGWGVGIARALVTDPKLIVADEPTGDLDSARSQEILDLLESLQLSLRKTILIVTHDPTAAARARRVLRIEKGVIVEDRASAAPVGLPPAALVEELKS
jgi:ABC-type lipoprotein export system ATPase subunit